MPDRDHARGFPGFGFVALGAALWGSDALFRRGLAIELPPTLIVAAEHVILTVVLAPVLWRQRKTLRALTPLEWGALIVIGVGASALATILFTTAFRYGDPNAPLLLQKLQPFVAVAGAVILLGERFRARYVAFFVVAVAGAFLMTFPEPWNITVEQAAPALYATGAAFLWGMGTVLGRYLSPTLSPRMLTASRLAIGTVVLVPAVFLRGEVTSHVPFENKELLALVLLGLIPGLAALMLYYRGLRTTAASAATLAELAFPISALVINWLAFDAVLKPLQYVGLTVLLVTIIAMSYLSRSGSVSADLGVEAPGRVLPVEA